MVTWARMITAERERKRDVKCDICFRVLIEGTS